MSNELEEKVRIQHLLKEGHSALDRIEATLFRMFAKVKAHKQNKGDWT